MATTTTPMLELIRKKEFVGYLVGFIGAFILFPYFLDAPVYPVGPPYYSSLDPSWRLILNKFNMDGLTWGKDVTFTYGPLAYLSTRIGWGMNKYMFLLFDLFVCFNFFYIFSSAYTKSKHKAAALVLMVFTIVLLPSLYATGNALVLMAFLIFWIRQSLYEGKPFFYIMQIIIIVLLFFIKFNTSLVSFILFLAALVYKFIFTKENKPLLGAYLLGVLGLIVLFSQVMHVAIMDYLKGGLNMVSGYNEIMYLDMPVDKELKYAWGIMALSTLVLLWKLYLERKTNLYRNLIVFMLFSASIYVLYKQAFVRNDISHNLDFNKFCLLLILCIPDFYYNQIGKYSYWIMGVILVISIQYAKKRDDKLMSFSERFSKGDYIKGFANFTDSSGLHLYPNNNQIPQNIKDKIGRSTVDVYPWNIQLLIENRLNYVPRPVFQSYTAYTPYLEDLNFNFYNSDKAPEFVLYAIENVDSRYTIFDESKVNLVILRNYEFVDFFNFAGNPILVLKKKSAAKKINLQKVNEESLNRMDVIHPKADSYYEIKVSSTFSGKIKSILEHSPEIYLIVTTKDGNQRAFKTSSKLLESGIFSNYYFNSTLDIYNYFTRKDSLNPGNEIISYGLKVGSEAHYYNMAKLTEYKIN